MEKYGRLTIRGYFVKRLYNKNRTHAYCVCECGTEKEVLLSDLKSGNTKSCGCLSRDIVIKRNTKHGLRYHPAYHTYNAMMARCYNEKDDGYHHYGGRGIKVCEEWHDIHKFTTWCESNGFEKKLQLDRKDNNKGYSPDNCHFVTPQINLRNTRWNVIIEGVPLKQYLDDLGEKYEIAFSTLVYRYYTITREGLEPNENNLVFNKRWLKKQ